MARLRIGLVRIAQESNAYSPVLSELDDYDRTHFFEGQDLLDILEPSGTEVEGFLKNAELSGALKAIRQFGGKKVEVVPLFSSWAMPGGPISKTCLAALQERLRTALQSAGHLDGLMFSMHGAMNADEHDDPESLFLNTVRDVLGPDCMVAVSLDLHGQMTKEFIDQIDILAAYRTNPHRDHAKTGFRAGRMLTRGLLGEIRPVLAWRSLPMVLGGGTTIDFLPTMRPVYKYLKTLEKQDGVLDASLFNCHLWARHDDLGWSGVVMVDGDRDKAEKLADDLADTLWAVRHKQPPELSSADDAINKVRSIRVRKRLGTICVCDASDIVGCGTPGENTRLVRAVWEEGSDLTAYMPIRDADVVNELWTTPIGHTVTVTVGNKLDPDNPAFTLTAALEKRVEHDTFGKMAVLRRGTTWLVVTERACLVMKPQFYAELDLSPWKADMVVVKSLFPFRLYFALHNRKTIYVKTRGASDFDRVTELDFNGPVHPLHAIDSWRGEDARRRGV